MFGECFDFAPTKGGRQNKYTPPAPKPIEATPREQAVRLAAQVGIESSLLDGVAPELVVGAKAGDLKAALHLAVAALQQGKAVPEVSPGVPHPLKDFLYAKIAVLPLLERFRLIAAWGGVLKPALSVPEPLASKKEKVPIKAGSFISFDSLPGADGQQQDRPAVQRPEPARAEPAAGSKKQKKSGKSAPVPAPVPEEYDDDERWDYGDAEEEEAEWQNVPENEPQKPAAKIAMKFLTTSVDPVLVDKEQMKRDAARREEDAKNAASKVLLSFQQTKAAVEAGLRATAQKSKTSSTAAGSRRSDGQPIDSRGSQRVDAGRDRNAEGDEHLDEEGAHHQRSRRRRRGDEEEPLREGDRHSHGYSRASRSRSRGYASRYDKDIQDQAQEAYDRLERDRRERDSGRRRDDGRGHDESRGHDRYERAGTSRRDREPRRSGGYDQDRDDRYERGVRGARDDERTDSRSRSYEIVSVGHSGRQSRGTESNRRREEGRSCDRDVSPGRDSDPPLKRARSPEGNDGKPVKTDADSSSRRKKNLMERFARSESPKRKAVAVFEQGVAGRAYKPDNQPIAAQGRGAAKAAAPEAPKATPPAKEPKLRQLAFKNGWAEYINEDSGQHVFKNIFTGEMTNRQPQELQSTITASQNQRRLQWLAGHRTTAMLNDLSMGGAQIGGPMPQTPLPSMGFGR